jgi:soluble lytic murein transglycosylase-like protein
MAWRLGLMMVWLMVLALASPGTAAIERFTDSQGVIHIRNGSGAANRPLLPSPAPEQAPPPPVTLPSQATAPVPTASENTAAVGRAAPEADNPQAPGPLARKDTPSGPDNHPTAETGENQAAAQAPGEAAGGATLPLKKVAWTPPADTSAPIPQTLAPVPAATAMNGGIRRFRDGQGVLHITNVPAAAAPGPTMLLAANAGESAAPPRPPAGAGEEGQGLPWQRVSCDGQEQIIKALAARSRAGQVGPPLPGAIRRYRDARGVWHIENFSPAEEQGIRQALLLARAARNRSESFLPVTDGGVAAGLTVKKAAWSEGDLGPPATGVAKVRSSKKSGLWAGETIKRYRDARGVVHIKSATPLEPALPPLAAADRQGLVGRAFAGNMPPLPAEKAVPGSPAPPSPSGAAGVMAYRDRKGKLIIGNREPELKIPRAPPREVASAAYDPIIAEASQAYNLPVPLIKAVIKVESNFVPWAVSPKGAMGMMQLMPGTAEFLGVREPFDPRENIHGGCRYLRRLLNYFGGDLPLALAAYNAGHQRVVDCGYKVPPIKETQEFVTTVLGRYYTAEQTALWPWT